MSFLWTSLGRLRTPLSVFCVVRRKKSTCNHDSLVQYRHKMCRTKVYTPMGQIRYEIWWTGKTEKHPVSNVISHTFLVPQTLERSEFQSANFESKLGATYKTCRNILETSSRNTFVSIFMPKFLFFEANESKQSSILGKF